MTNHKKNNKNEGLNENDENNSNKLKNTKSKNKKKGKRGKKKSLKLDELIIEQKKILELLELQKIRETIDNSKKENNIKLDITNKKDNITNKKDNITNKKDDIKNKNVITFEQYKKKLKKERENNSDQKNKSNHITVSLKEKYLQTKKNSKFPAAPPATPPAIPLATPPSSPEKSSKNLLNKIFLLPPLPPIKNPPFIPPLTLDNDETNETNEKNEINNKTDINEKNKDFNMKLETVLDKIKKNREENKKLIEINEKTKKYKTFLEELDKIHNNLNTLQSKIVNNDNNKDGNNYNNNINNINNVEYNNGKLVTNKETENEERNTLINTLSVIDSAFKNNFSDSNITGWNSNLNVSSDQINSNPDIDESQKKYLLDNGNPAYSEEELRQKLFSPNKPLPSIERKKVNIDVEIESINDIIKLTEDYPIKYDVEYNINMKAMHDIKRPLVELNSMIGLNSLKERVVDQILYYVQDLHKVNSYKGDDFMHTVIYGPPGTGKTEAAKLLGRIFSSLGVLKKGTFRKVVRSDLIAGYLGQTALKTRDVISESLGGVLFIDEAYALGNDEKRDSFAKECIDTLCEGLSDHKDNLMVIIAGYEKELKECFFNYNPGLESRFTWRFETDDYKANELMKIFEKKVKDAGWEIKEGELKESWFSDNMNHFKFYGRDMETLFSKVKIAHSRRVFCKPKEEKTKITIKDMEKGLKTYLLNTEDKEAEKEKKKFEDELVAKLYM